MTKLSRISGRRRLAAAAVLALLTIGAVGCAADNDSDSSERISSSSDAPRPAAGESGDFAAPKDGVDAEQSAESYAADQNGNAANLNQEASQASAEGGDVADTDRKLISNGNVALQSDDVSQTQFDVVGVSDKYAGEVESKESETDKEGEVIRSRMVLRIPTAQFIEAMDDLSDTAQLLSNNSSTADVTTEVLDKDIRIKIQRSSIERIELLLDRAESIRDIVSIEAQLSRRQADLATLEQKQRYLADQTAMSTVTVSIQQTPEKRKKKEEERDTAGFLVGLSDGWNALQGAATNVATAVGAVLPFALVGAVIAFPIWTILRRRRRTTSTASAS